MSRRRPQHVWKSHAQIEADRKREARLAELTATFGEARARLILAVDTLKPHQIDALIAKIRYCASCDLHVVDRCWGCSGEGQAEPVPPKVRVA